MSAHDKHCKVNGVWRCCIAALAAFNLPAEVPVGYVVPCANCDDGMVWTGEVWMGRWRYTETHP